MTLEERLAGLTADAGDVQVKGSDYLRNGQSFAVRPGAGVIDLRLGPDIADAAMRTADTHPSTRGADWIRFAPKAWDDHARDRLEAWFRVAWRLAAGPQK
jgi:hypothetical protein